MPDLKFKATEMKSAKVERISLVERGANRIPFRITKEDRTMSKDRAFDLASVFKRENPVEKPAIIGFVTMKGDAFEATKAAIKAAGFDVTKEVVGKDDTVVFKQGDVEIPKDAVIVKLSDTVAVVTKGFSPYSMSMTVGDGQSFNDACVAQGFYPGISTMVDVLRSSVYDLASKADDPGEAATNVSKMFDEARDYCVGMVKALPVSAFKLEAGPGDEEEGAGDGGDAAGTKVTKAAMTMPKGMDQKKWDAMSDTEKAKAVEDAKDGGDDDAEENADGTKKAKKVEAKKAGDGTTDGPNDGSGNGGIAVPGGTQTTGVGAKAAEQPDIEKLLASAMTQLGTKLAAELKGEITTAVSEVKKSVDGMKTNLETLNGRVEEAESVAKAAKEAVDGTVLGSDAGGDAIGTQKSDKGGYRGGEIDTAFTPRTRRPAR